MVKKLVCFAALMLASGCTTYSLEELRHTEPKGSEFNQVLTFRYLDFAEAEAKEYDWTDSARFAAKGLLAAYDSEVGPEELSNYSLPVKSIATLEEARADLLLQLTPKNMAERPAVAADALFYFDCWVEQQEENNSADDIEYCRSRFKDRIAELKDVSYVKVLRDQGMLGPEIDTTSYIVFFQWGQSIIGEDGILIIDQVVNALKSQDKYEVILNGHTDTSGDARYNLQLSSRRADAVKARLVAGGVKEEAIQIFAYGESDPKDKTKDGIKEKNNRRVEIFLGE